MEIVYSDTLVNTPARLLVKEQKILVNAKVWDKLPEPYQKFILAHEEGHFNLKTSSELIADHYAFNKLAGQYQNSLKSMVNTVASILSESTNHQMRVKNIYKLALEWDIKNGNSSVQPEFEKISSEIEKEYRNNLEYVYYKKVFMKNYNLETYDWQSPEAALYQPKIGRTFINVMPNTMQQTTSSTNIQTPAFFEKFVSPIAEELKKNQQLKFYMNNNSSKTTEPESVYVDTQTEPKQKLTSPAIFPDVAKTPDYKLYALIALAVIAFFILIKL